MRTPLLLVVYLMLSFTAVAQQKSTIFYKPDTVVVFPLEVFLDQVTRSHPVVRQTNLLSDIARQEIRIARGNFDPKLSLNYDTKEANNLTYYRELNSEIKFPMNIPIDPKIGVERNTGTYINPRDITGTKNTATQVYTGISMTLGRGLITDERRTALRQAELFTQYTEAEQVKIINKLLLEAAKAYWNWTLAYYNYLLNLNNNEIAAEILRRSIVNFQLGEAPAIDTVQATITYIQRKVELQESRAEMINSRLNVSMFLWDSTAAPLILQPNAAPDIEEIPARLTEAELANLVSLAQENHPELRKIDVKLLQIEADTRLAKEFLKPILNLDYSLLNQPLDAEGNSNFDPQDNYKFGIDLSFPLFLRKERGKLAQLRIKSEQTEYERGVAERQILIDINTAYQTIAAAQNILIDQINLVNNYQRLLDAELLNLENGESDLFKINIQTEKLIQAKAKALKLRIELEKQKATLYWASGVSRLYR